MLICQLAQSDLEARQGCPASLFAELQHVDRAAPKIP